MQSRHDGLCQGLDRGGEALVGELVHPGGSLGVLNGKADDVPVNVRVEVDIRHEIVEKRLRERNLSVLNGGANFTLGA